MRETVMGESALFWRIALGVSLLALLMEFTLPGSYPVTAALVFFPLASLVQKSRPLTARLTALVVGSAVLAGTVAVARGPTLNPQEVVLRLGEVLAMMLVGGACMWALREQMAESSGPPPELADLRAADMLERTAHILAHLTGAKEVSVQRMRNVEDTARRMLGPRRKSPLSGLFDDPESLSLRRQTSSQAWDDPEARRVLVKLRRPGQGEALVTLHGPTAPFSFTLDAVGVLQAQLERAALLEELQMQRELLRDLVYAFSHDLRTPLTASSISLQAALQGAYGPLSDEFKSVLRRQLDASRGLLELSDQLLLMAEYESGGPEVENRLHVNLRDVVQDVAADLAHKARAKNIHLALPATTAWVHGQPFDLRRAAQNLIENALKFTPPGSTVTVDLTNAGQQVALRVQDEGPGVPEAQLPHLFQGFRAAMPGSGSGVGLYLTRRIAERHGGTLTYHRRPGNPTNTVFTLKLPLSEPEAPSP